MKANHRHIMDISLLVFLFFGCLVTGRLAENHSTEVKNIFNNFDTLNKLMRNNDTTPIVCVESVDELTDIENALFRIKELLPGAYDDVSIQFSLECSQLASFKTEFLKMVNEFDVLTIAPTLSLNYRSHKTRFEPKIVLMKSLLEGAQKVSTGVQLEMIVKLQNEFQAHQNQMLQMFSNLESEQRLLNDANVQIAITSLQEGKVDEALAAFVNVTDHDIQIEKLIATVYGNGDNFGVINRFAFRLPIVSRIIGYKALYEQLKKNNQMDHRIWILATAINELPAKDSVFIETVMAYVKTIVRNNNLDGLTGFLNQHGAEGIEAMKQFGPVFVRTFYEETENGIEKFFAFLEKLTFIRHRLYLTNELILMLKASDRMYGKDMSMIVFELIKLRSVERPQNKFWQKLIEQNLPEELRDLMYSNLCIQNAENDEYLFASVPVNETQRHVYTAKTQSLNESFSWQVYLIEYGTKLLIKNNKYGVHLYLIDEGQHDDEHVLRSYTPSLGMGDTKAEFYLDMLGNGEFLIVNKYFDQILYSPFDNEPNASNNRPVFSKKYDRKNVEIDSKWIIGICRLDVEYVF